MIRAAVAIAFTAVATAVSFQQAPRAIMLRPADATLGEPFTSIYSFVSLPTDGYSSATTAQTIGVVVADLASGRVRTGRQCGGRTREYRKPGNSSSSLAIRHS